MLLRTFTKECINICKNNKTIIQNIICITFLIILWYILAILYYRVTDFKKGKIKFMKYVKKSHWPFGLKWGSDYRKLRLTRDLTVL